MPFSKIIPVRGQSSEIAKDLLWGGHFVMAMCRRNLTSLSTFVDGMRASFCIRFLSIPS